MTDLAFWQAFLSCDFGSERARRVLADVLRSADPLAALRSHPHLRTAEAQRCRAADLDRAVRAAERGAFVLTESELPEPLRAAPGSPPALFAIGRREVLERPAVAIVGTRAASTYGKAVSRKFAQYLARAGCVVASGGALGIDTAAHRGALEEGGVTVAVLGNGLDIAFPAQNGPLFTSIAGSGLLLSPYPFGVKARSHFFLVRNQILASLCSAVLVVEAPEGSGSITTAHAAAELGRPVFVAPANIDNLGFRGSHALIRDGAILADHPDVILGDLGLPSVAPVAEPETSGLHARILEALESDPLPLEIVAHRTGLDSEELLAELTTLEVDGRVTRGGLGYARSL